jgi:hypothetical protein
MRIAPSLLSFLTRRACAQNDDELERALSELAHITKTETARAELAASALRRERAAAAAAALGEADAELERRLAAPASPVSSWANVEHEDAPAREERGGLSWTDDISPRSEPDGGDGNAAASSGGAEEAVRVLTAKLLEQRRARAAASATRIAQLAQHRKCVCACAHPFLGLPFERTHTLT